jgi:CRP/FNR family cyclic AMP-dependent transcriptional regulator
VRDGSAAGVCKAERVSYGRIRVLEVDEELGTAVPGPQRGSATRAALFDVLTLEPGPSDPGARGLPAAGFLVLGGCITREVSVLGQEMAVDFFGHGDLVRPAEEQPLLSVASDASWVVLERTRLAVLDAEFLVSVQPWPQIVAGLLRRQERRADWLAHVLAVSHLPRVQLRVLVLFWLFADRWGRRRGNEVAVPIPLTHVNIARLIGARRPTVTSAIHQLIQAGRIASDGNGHWVLHGQPPETIRSLPASD